MHHPDICAALEILSRSAPAATERLSKALRVLLWQAYASDAPRAWQFSRLTGDGFPFELAFTTADAHLRYTADPGSPDMAALERLPYAVGLLSELGQPPIDPQVLTYLVTMQQAGTSLDYGAWIGGRHALDRPDTDRFKLYAEVPPGDLAAHLPFLSVYLNLPARLLTRPVQWRMLAIEPATGRLEFYFRYQSLAPDTLPLLLQPAGLHARSEELLDFLQQAYAHALGERIPGGSVGFSYALIPGHQAINFSLFLFTRLLWGGDARIRPRFSERLQAAGRDSSAYWQITSPLAERDIYQTYHGLLGVGVSAQSPIQLSLSVRPPPCER